MNEKATPTATDSGTLFPEIPVCTNCGQEIRRVHPRPAQTEKAARAWVHVHNSSTYCYGR
jgi:hypothetical protein